MAVVQIDEQSKKRTVSQSAYEAESTAFHTVGAAVSLGLLGISNWPYECDASVRCRQ